MTPQELLTLVREADPKDDAAFQRIIAQAFALGIITYSTAAHRFGTSRTSIEHWRLGTHAPHPAMRNSVYLWVRDEITKAVESPV